MKSLQDFIHLKNIDSSIVLKKIKEYDESLWEKAEVLNNQSNSNIRNTDQLTITNDYQFNYFNTEVHNYILENVLEYCKEFKVPITEDEGYRILRYGVGQHYKIHIDSNKFYPRVLSLVWILNNDFEGGDLIFPELDLKIDLTKNNFVIFPSSFMFKHKVTEVTKGTKYSLVTWLK